MPQIAAALSPQGFFWLLAGGVVYTADMVPFAVKRKYNHCIWHIFVLAAAALHWFGIYTQIYA
jgi:hemolysin III